VAVVVEVSPLAAADVAAAVELLQSYGVADVAAAVSLPQPSLIVVARTWPSAAEGEAADYYHPSEAASTAVVAVVVQLLDYYYYYCY